MRSKKRPENTDCSRGRVTLVSNKSSASGMEWKKLIMMGVKWEEKHSD